VLFLGRILNKMLGLSFQLILLALVREALIPFSNTSMFTIFTIYVICISLSFTEELLTFTTMVESSTLPLVFKKISYLSIQKEALICIILIWIISIQLQAVINLL